jgi:hypothetical protein
MNASAGSGLKVHRLAVFCGLAALVVLWPSELSWVRAAAILFFALLMLVLCLVELAPWAYRWVWAGVAVPLSYVAVAVAAWSAGAGITTIALSAAVLGTSFAAIAIFVARRR